MPSTSGSSSVDALIRELATDIRDQRVLEAIRAVPRERFVPPEFRAYAYENEPLPIAAEQTISQPLIVAMMTEALALTGGERVLEIGTGSGYQAAVLARLAREVVSVEVHDVLRHGAEQALQELGVTTVRCLEAGAVLGAPDLAPFDAIIVTAAAPRVPPSVLAQLVEGGRLVIPVGTRANQELLVVTKGSGGETAERSLGGCRFVPLVGSDGFEPEHH
ncbi:MAG: protein-L-isoaspartate(D-aspartate) O-methyltransferase [Dehalococcoidia bacterium]|nr:protein-L-isoaspartate(D-aspartate) O-methyltransferase [Dehalococcoidia bacterium]